METPRAGLASRSHAQTRGGDRGLAPRDQARGRAPASSCLLLLSERGICAGRGWRCWGQGTAPGRDKRRWGRGGAHVEQLTRATHWESKRPPSGGPSAA